MLSLFAGLACLACLVPFTSAWTKPVGDTPEGNPIALPGLNDVLPVGVPYTITWEPTTPGTVTLLLLKGPSENAVAQYAIAEGVNNVGTYVWVPEENLAPGQTGYGVQLIDDATGQYQYTTQFGIENSDYESSKPSHGAPAYASKSAAPSSYAPASSASAYPSSVAQSSYVASSSFAASSGYSSSAVASSGYAHPTGWPWNHHSMSGPAGYAPYGTAPVASGHAKPTLHKTTSSVPASSYGPSATGGSPPVQATGAAATIATSFFGLVFAAGVAVFAL